MFVVQLRRGSRYGSPAAADCGYADTHIWYQGSEVGYVAAVAVMAL